MTFSRASRKASPDGFDDGTVALREHVTLLTGFPFKSEFYTEQPDGVRLVRGDNVVQGQLRWDNAKRWPPDRIDEAKGYELREGDVVLAMDRPWIEAGLKYARIGSGDMPSLLVQRVACLRAKNGLDQGYLFYLIGSHRFTDHVLSIQTGTAVPHISGSQILQFRYRPLPLDRQRAIAAVLRSLDDKIEQNRRTGAKLGELARAVFKAWFVDFEPVKAKAAGAKSFPGMPPATFTALPTTFQDSPIGPVPEGWRVQAVADAFEVNPGRRLVKGADAPYLDMKNMPTEGHAPETWERRQHGSGMRFVNGDTLVARITPCLENGKTAFVDFLADEEVGWGSTEYIVLRPRPPLPDEFAYLLARTNAFREFAIQNMSGTSGRQRVAASAMEHYQLAVPSEPICRAFGSAVRPLFRWTRAAMNESRKLAQIRDYLLPKLLSGHVRVAGGGSA